MPARLLVWAGALTLIAGCEKPVETKSFQGFDGTVISVDLQTSELFLRLGNDSSTRDGRPRTLVWLVNDTSETYVNDRVASLGAIRPGDHAEILGYRDTDPDRPAQYIVSVAHIRREQPVPEPPDLTIPTATPTTEEGG